MIGLARFLTRFVQDDLLPMRRYLCSDKPGVFSKASEMVNIFAAQGSRKFADGAGALNALSFTLLTSHSI